MMTRLLLAVLLFAIVGLYAIYLFRIKSASSPKFFGFDIAMMTATLGAIFASGFTCFFFAKLYHFDVFWFGFIAIAGIVAVELVFLSGKKK